jgi:hypothetical protein
MTNTVVFSILKHLYLINRDHMSRCKRTVSSVSYSRRYIHRYYISVELLARKTKFKINVPVLRIIVKL